MRTKLPNSLNVNAHELRGALIAYGYLNSHADRIVSAINAHEELLLLAKAYLSDLKAKRMEDHGPVKYVEDVINKAEGK